MYTIHLSSPDNPDVCRLIDALDRYQQTLYPAESNHLLDLTALPASQVAVLLIQDNHQQGVGCGAVVLNSDGSGEIKRVYIDPQARGQRLGEKLLDALEKEALRRSCHTLRLETGIHQQAAITLYERGGYFNCPAFPPYQPDPLSLFMEKVLCEDLRSAML